VATKNLKQAFENVSFIIFNYDRNVEHYLHQALMAYNHLSSDVAGEILSGVSFCHPYGVVGALPWQARLSPGALAVNYGQRIDSAQCADLIDRIHTYTERKGSPDELGKLRDLLTNAQAIVFLGFGYIEQNMELLTIQNTSIKKVYATVFEQSEENVKVIGRRIDKALSGVAGRARFDVEVRLMMPDLSCAKMFDHYSLSITD
jgi:hypothetical protein